MKSGYLHINNNIFETLLAISEEEQKTGLMYREWIPPVMSFIYEQPSYNAFWMQNTPSPLDIVFCKKGEIIDIHKGEPFSTKIIQAHEMSDLVIEFPYGTMISCNIKLGNKVEIVSPTPGELKKIISEKRNFNFKI